MWGCCCHGGFPRVKSPPFGWGELSPICFHKIKIPCIFSMGPVGGPRVGGKSKITKRPQQGGMNGAIFVVRFSQHILVVWLVGGGWGWCGVMGRR